MTVVFNPVPAPSFSLDDDHQPKMNIVAYGDGYTGRVPDGINNDLEKPTLNWVNLTADEYKTLKAFAKEYAASGEHFLYTMPWTNDGDDEERLYYCISWSRSRPEAGAWNLTMNLQEVVEAA